MRSDGGQARARATVERRNDGRFACGKVGGSDGRVACGGHAEAMQARVRSDGAMERWYRVACCWACGADWDGRVERCVAAMWWQRAEAMHRRSDGRVACGWGMRSRLRRSRGAMCGSVRKRRSARRFAYHGSAQTHTHTHVVLEPMCTRGARGDGPRVERGVVAMKREHGGSRRERGWEARAPFVPGWDTDVVKCCFAGCFFAQGPAMRQTTSHTRFALDGITMAECTRRRRARARSTRVVAASGWRAPATKGHKGEPSSWVDDCHVGSTPERYFP